MKKTIKRRHLKSPDGVVTCTIFRSPQTSRRLECEKSIKTKLENVQNGLTCALQFAQILTTTSLYSDYLFSNGDGSGGNGGGGDGKEGE